MRTACGINDARLNLGDRPHNFPTALPLLSGRYARRYVGFSCIVERVEP